ncbi:Pre-mRNA-splicing factor SPF27 [Zopfochytrium polystomum]|nr:Pre-mRNA-splicing factor SPF27 [Zopfochytrium polystomum]
MALPYIDKELESDDAKAFVNSLIQEEVRAHPEIKPPSIPEFEIFKDNPFLSRELERVGTGQKTPGAGIDTSKYRLEPPKSTGDPAADLAAWESAVSNAHAQLEHQHSRLINLELIKKYGGNAWRVHNYQLESLVERAKEAVARQKEEMTALNKERKIEQLRVGTTLNALESRWAELVDQSLRVDIACQILEAEIQAYGGGGGAGGAGGGENGK